MVWRIYRHSVSPVDHSPQTRHNWVSPRFQGSASHLREHMVDIRDMRYFIDRKSWLNSKFKARIESPCYRFLIISMILTRYSGRSIALPSDDERTKILDNRTQFLDISLVLPNILNFFLNTLQNPDGSSVIVDFPSCLQSFSNDCSVGN